MDHAFLYEVILNCSDIFGIQEGSTVLYSLIHTTYIFLPSGQKCNASPIHFHLLYSLNWPDAACHGNMCVISTMTFRFLVHSKYIFITCSTPFLSKPLIIKQNWKLYIQYFLRKGNQLFTNYKFLTPYSRYTYGFLLETSS